MSVLYLSFNRHLHDDSKRLRDIYSESLLTQYTRLRRRLPEIGRKLSFENFVLTIILQSVETGFKLTYPNFKRDIDQKQEFLNNIVIRPNLSAIQRKYLPEGQDVIFVGDIKLASKNRVLDVKGVELIDSSMDSNKDICFVANPKIDFYSSNAFSNEQNSVFNDNFITSMIKDCWPVTDYRKVIQYYDQWHEYMEFIKYYIGVKSNKTYEVEQPELIHAFTISGHNYKRHSDVLETFLLDNSKAFVHSDMAILSKQMYDAVPLDLIRIHFDINKSQYIANTNKNNRNKFVDELLNFTSENVVLSENSFAKFEKDKSDYSRVIQNGLHLGDRFCFYEREIEPKEKISDIKSKYNQMRQERTVAIEEAFKEQISKKIKEKHEKDIKLEVKKEISEEYNRFIESSKKEFDELVARNRNKFIKSVRNKEKNIAQSKLDNLVKKHSSDFEKEAQLESNNKLTNYKTQAQLSFNNSVTSKLLSLINSELNNRNGELVKQKRDAEKLIKDNEESDINKCIENDTICRIYFYFKLPGNEDLAIEETIRKVKKSKYLVYDNIAQEAKRKRQEEALESFIVGNVKNPYLSKYLFESDKLKSIVIKNEDWMWFQTRLNKKQKEATMKAFFSNGIFLLQGPPGTGKTEVITEIVAHLVQAGRKVLVSSETHKAIDNVFERLPKIPDIISLRLIPSEKNKKNPNEYDPQFLVNHFYGNITQRMKDAMNRYENFTKMQEEFNEKYDELKIKISKLNKSKDILDNAKKDTDKLATERSRLSDQIASKKEQIEGLDEALEKIRKEKSFINNLHANDDDLQGSSLLLEFKNGLINLIDKEKFNSKNIEEFVNRINDIDISKVTMELALYNVDSKSNLLLAQRDEVRAKLETCYKDFELLPGKEKEAENLKEKLRSLKNKINNLDDVSNDNILSSIFKEKFLISSKAVALEELEKLKKSISDFKQKYLDRIKGKEKEINDKKSIIEKERLELKNSRLEIKDKIDKINNEELIKNLHSIKKDVENSIDDFFKTYEIDEGYSTFDNALLLMQNKLIELNQDSEKNGIKYKNRIPMYKKIVDYLERDDIIAQDKDEYTKALYERANVFGITCTSRDTYSKDKMNSMSNFDLDDLNLKKVGIDVVIIDEVSKSSFLDLLIPILYGKTVILVGDHRQLPPTYDLAKMDDRQIDSLDSNFITKAKNIEYTKLYEECFFKTLFEKTPNDYKTMLELQYRCHEDIMRVTNHFYSNRLKLGDKNQNEKKKHNIDIEFTSGARITPDKNIYFINSNGPEGRDDGSTSIYNVEEQNVVITLIKKMNLYYQTFKGKKLSLGVICTYGSQAKKINRRLDKMPGSTSMFKHKDEGLIVSTVDDFQGDERDIIILSLVRSPSKSKKSSATFIKSYQRINVALSRARCLLIVVGNRKFLEEKGLISLPGIDDDSSTQKNVRIYKEIISTIGAYGDIFEAEDILEEKE